MKKMKISLLYQMGNKRGVKTMTMTRLMKTITLSRMSMVSQRLEKRSPK
jgi:hypothetical protein